MNNPEVEKAWAELEKYSMLEHAATELHEHMSIAVMDLRYRLDEIERLRAIEQAQAPAASDPAPDDAAAIEAAWKAYTAAKDANIDEIGESVLWPSHATKAFTLAYHSEASKLDAATIAELREQVKELRNRREIACDLLSRERDFREQVNERLRRRIEELETQLSARPAPGEVPELTEEDFRTIWAESNCGLGSWDAVGDDSKETRRKIIRAAFAKMPRREAFDATAEEISEILNAMPAWCGGVTRSEWQRLSDQDRAWAVKCFRKAIKAAGVPVKEST